MKRKIAIAFWSVIGAVARAVEDVAWRVRFYAMVQRLKNLPWRVEL